MVRTVPESGGRTREQASNRSIKGRVATAELSKIQFGGMPKMECPPVGWLCPQHPQLPLRFPSVALRRRREPTSGASATAGCHGLLRWLRSCECGRGKNSTESHYSGKASGKASIEISSAKAFTQCEGVPSASRTSSHAQPHPMIPFGAVRPFSASCDAQHSAPIKSVLIS